MKTRSSTATTGRPSKTSEKMELKSKLSFTRDRSALAEPIENFVLSSMQEFTAKLIEYADAIEDRVIHVVTSSAYSVNQGYRFWCSKDAFTTDTLFDLAHTMFKVALVIAMGVASYTVFLSDESDMYLLFALAGGFVATKVSVDVLRDAPFQLMELYAKIQGRPSQRMQVFCAHVAHSTAVLTERGLIYANYNKAPKPILVEWRNIGSARLVGGADIALNDLDGKQAVRLEAPSTNTMTHTEVFEFIREQINLAHVDRLKETSEAL